MSSRPLAILVALAITSACNGSDEQGRGPSGLIKPEQIQADLGFVRDGEESVSKLASRLASKLNMEVDHQTFEYGGENGSSIAYLLSDADSAVMFTSHREEADHDNGPPPITFSKNLYAVSIYRTSNRAPEHSLRDIFDLLDDEVAKLGGTLDELPTQDGN